MSVPIQISGRPPVIPPSNGAHVLVLSCIDPRFTEFLAWFLINYKAVHSNYDLFSLAGASLGVNQVVFTNWKGVFFDHLALALDLHEISEVWAFDHLDCGAYKQFKVLTVDDDVGKHTEELQKLQQSLATYTGSTNLTVNTKIQQLAFKGFVMSTEGSIFKVVDDGRGVEVSRGDLARSSRSVNMLISAAIGFLLIAVLFNLLYTNNNG
jgi:hypothetical protein